MQRRDFLIGSAATAAVLAEPSLPDLGLFPRQEMMRQRARTASEVHLLWGQRSGKGRTAAAIVADRIARNGALSICLVGGHPYCLSTTVDSISQDLETLGISPDGNMERSLRLESPTSFLNRSSTFDIVVLNTVDWQEVPAYRLINHAKEISPFVLSESSPHRRNSDYMNYVLFHGSLNLPGYAFDWASTWEVNPNVTRLSLETEELFYNEQWERDFAVYKR